MKFIKYILFLFVSLIGFLIYFFFNLGNFLDVTQEPSKTELLVCLGGGISNSRTEKTIELYKNDFLKKKNIVFTGIPSLEKKIYKRFDENTNIIIEYKLKNTMEEVLFVKKFIKENNISSITFITEPPHSRRIKIFWEHFGEKLDNVKFSIVASELKSWNSEDYYKNKINREYAFSEFTKLVYNFFIYGILENIGLREKFESTYKKELMESKNELNIKFH